jgi:hypothetical protein
MHFVRVRICAQPRWTRLSLFDIVNQKQRRKPQGGYMPTAHDQVEALLDELRDRVRDPDVEKLSAQISLLCRGYMEPDAADPLPGVRLTPNERSILVLLMARAGRAVSRGALLDAASYHHGWDREPAPKIVDVYICRLRAKLKGRGWRIETVWGQGYRLVVADVAPVASDLGAGPHPAFRRLRHRERHTFDPGQRDAQRTHRDGSGQPGARNGASQAIPPRRQRQP